MSGKQTSTIYKVGSLYKTGDTYGITPGRVPRSQEPLQELEKSIPENEIFLVVNLKDINYTGNYRSMYDVQILYKDKVLWIFSDTDCDGDVVEIK
jgi:hypothetical protein